LAYPSDTYQDKVELAKACLVGLCANFEAPHHKPRELAAKALDFAGAFYDELDAREAAHEAAEQAAGKTEPPPGFDPIPSAGALSSILPPEDRPAPVSQPATPVSVTADRPWSGGDLDHAG